MPGTPSSLQPSLSCKKKGAGNGGHQGVELRTVRTLTRSVSVHDDPSSAAITGECEMGAMPACSHTATPSLIGRWKKSLKRKMTGSPAASVVGARTELEEPTIDITNLISFDEPQDYGSDSLDTELELSVRICREGIRTGLLDLMRNLGGDVRLLEAIEDGKNSARDLLRSATPSERQIALLWSAFQRRRELLPDLIPDTDLEFCTPEDGLTALHLAAFSASPDCVRFLLEAGARQTRPQTLSPLHCAALGNSTECVRLLLTAGATVNLSAKEIHLSEPQDSPLHSAVKANAPECVTQLLSAGANAAAIGEGGLTPLHIAADLGYTECLKVLVLSGKEVEVNAKTQDRRGYSALHLAAEEECAEALELLLQHGADPASRNYRGQTPLHIAARVQSLECINVLLRVSDVNAGDADRRTPLHTAVGRAAMAAETAELLAKASGVNINSADRYGHTALHVAAVNELPAAAAVLIKCGSDLTARTKRGHTALGLVARKTPAALYAIEEALDSSIRMSYETNRDRDVELKLDFRPLLPATRRIEVSVLSTFISEGHPELLQHPLCQAFLHLKWQTIRKFYFLRLLLSFLFIVCLSLYVLAFLTTCSQKDEIRTRALFGDSKKDASTQNIDPLCKKRNFLGILERNRENDPLLNTLRQGFNYALLVLAGVEMSRKFYGLIASLTSATTTSIPAALKVYVYQLDNILEWFSLLSVPLISHSIWTTTHTWQTHVGAFAVLAGWTNLMIMIGQLPLFGAYVAMYTCVLREFLKLLGAYICLLIGFAISFCVMFPNAPEFANPLVAMVKTLVMMTGELEFKDLVLESDDDKKNDNGTQSDGSGKSDNTAHALNISPHIIFVLCLLLVTVALMNLLVGIAVHDIHGLRTSAGLSKLQRQADLVAYVETALSGGCCSCSTLQYPCTSLFSTQLRCVHNTRRTRSNSTILHIKPHNHFDTRLPRDIVKAALEVAKCRRPGKQNGGYNRQSSSSTAALSTVPRKELAASTLASRRRTVYLKSDAGATAEQVAMLESETLQLVRQLAEEVQDLRQVLNQNQTMLRHLMTANLPISGPD